MKESELKTCSIGSAASRLVSLLAVAMASMGTAEAQQPPAAATVKPLLTKGGCLACHSVDKKVVGPAFRDVAAKYKGDATAVDRLAEKIVKGGAGAWGPVPMPPASGISPADAKILATWVLAGAPAN